MVPSRFSSIYPDYRERVLRHEAAHLLVRTTSSRDGRVTKTSRTPNQPCQSRSQCSASGSASLAHAATSCQFTCLAMSNCLSCFQAGYLFGVPVTAYSLDLGETIQKLTVRLHCLLRAACVPSQTYGAQCSRNCGLLQCWHAA